MQIWVTTRADIPTVDRLLAESYPKLLKDDYLPSILVTAIPVISKARPELVTGGTYYLVDDEGGAALGCGGWTVAAPAGRSARGIAHIRHVATHPKATRRGVGRMIMEHVFAKARAASMREMMCFSTLTAVPFYTACGFTALREVEVPLMNGIAFPAVEMSRRL